MSNKGRLNGARLCRTIREWVFRKPPLFLAPEIPLGFYPFMLRRRRLVQRAVFCLACSPSAWPACILGRRFLFYYVRPNRFVHPGSRRKGPKGKRSTLVFRGRRAHAHIVLPHGPRRRKNKNPRKRPSHENWRSPWPAQIFFSHTCAPWRIAAVSFLFLLFSFPYLFLFVGTVFRCAVACSQALSSSVAEQKQTGYNRRLVLLSSAIAPVWFIFPSIFCASSAWR